MQKFENIVFEGGGVKGIAYVGALKAIDEHNIIKDLKRVGGTSAGAITATFIALGFSVQDTTKILSETKFKSFMDDKFGIIRDIWNIFTDYGWYKGDKFSKWLKKYIEEATGSQSTTFRNIHEFHESNPEKIKDLYVIATNLTKQEEMVFSYETTPDTPIWKAVRASMSIPIFFQAFHDKKTDDLLVDGGIGWNYPIDLFDHVRYLEDTTIIEPNGRGKPYNKSTIGVRVDGSEEIYRTQQGIKPTANIKGIKSYLIALVTFMMEVMSKRHVYKEDKHRTIYINTFNVGATEFDIDDKTTQKLIDSGYTSTLQYFKWFNDQNNTPLNRI